MKAQIIAVGTELLMGQIANTNAQYISQKLSELGINLYSHVVVGDNMARMTQALQRGYEEAEVLILTGGLGPTQDDLTKEVVSLYFGRELYLHEESLTAIIERFRTLGRPMTENNKKQALAPKGALVLPNPNGTAPGYIIEKGAQCSILLPGPPREMIPMFENHVYPYLATRSGGVIRSKYLKLFGIGESALETLLLPLINNQTNPTLATYAGTGDMTLRVTAKADSNEKAESLLGPMVAEISKLAGEHIYSTEGDSPEAALIKRLAAKNLTLATAESCTGGMIASRITAIPGVSAFFLEGVITYSNASKMDLLGVMEETLIRHGAVSAETAIEMAHGIQKRAGSSLGLSVTGIAGPSGGTPEKPVGLVYISVTDGRECSTLQLNLNGDRERIRTLASLHALNLAREFIRG